LQLALLEITNSNWIFKFELPAVGWRGGRCASAGQGGAGGRRDVFRAPAEQVFLAGFARDFFLKAAFFFFFESCLHMALNAGSGELATRT
jgi:hypothetical protein